jgi:hypothetical protein
MDEQEYRIIDMLSRSIGNPMSINELTKKIEKTHGMAHYANIYAKIQNLESEKIITLSKVGKSSLASLNFENYMLIDMLAETDLKRKQNFLRGRQEMQMLMLELDTYLHNILLIKSTSLMNPEQNARLNKAEILIHLKKSDDRKLIQESKISVHTVLDTIQRIHNIRIDYLLLEDEAFFDMLKSNESNPLREMLHNKIAILHPQDFWLTIRNAAESGIKIVTEYGTNPAKISEQDIIFNLTRFGYTELGPKIKQGRLLCIEYIISAIIFHNDARRIDAIPIIMAKNKTNYDNLLFLARKYGFGGRILGILKILQNLVHIILDEPIMLLEAMKIEEIKADSKSIKEKLRLYNVTR